MKNSNMMRGLIVSFILVLGTAALGHAAATVTASPSANGRLTVQGNGLAGVAAIEIAIQYDTTALANPMVVQGSLISGMPMVINSAPGLFRYAGVDPFPNARSGSGPLATISFDTVGGASGGVTVSTRLKDSNGADLPGQPNVFQVTMAGSGSGLKADSASKADSGSKDVLVTPPAATTGTKYPTYLGTVTMPDSGTTDVAKTNEDASPGISEAEKTQKQATETDEKGASLTGNVLERFRVFQGEKSPQKLIALFKSAMAGSSQKPPLALSDGKTIVTFLVNLPAASKSEPEFALKEAKLVSLNKSGDSSWEVELLPNKGTLEAAVIVMLDGKMAELPLTVAPPLAADPKTGEARTLTEADFTDFLKQRSTGDGVRSGLNSDGKHDYIDDYIYTANFLAQNDAAKTAAEKKPQDVKQ